MEEELNQSGEEYEAAAPEYQENEQVVPEQTQEQQVPLSALQAERAERQRMQEEMKLIKDHLSLMQANQQDQAKQPKDDPYGGMQDDDVLTVGEAKKFLNQMNNSYSASIEELKMMQRYPDYQETIQKYLPSVLKSNPSLRKTLEQTNNYELAYYLAKNSPDYTAEATKNKKSQVAEKILRNAEQPGSLSSTGASTPVQMVKDYKKMSDEEFRALTNRNMGFA